MKVLERALAMLEHTHGKQSLEITVPSQLKFWEIWRVVKRMNRTTTAVRTDAMRIEVFFLPIVEERFSYKKYVAKTLDFAIHNPTSNLSGLVPD